MKLAKKQTSYLTQYYTEETVKEQFRKMEGPVLEVNDSVAIKVLALRLC